MVAVPGTPAVTRPLSSIAATLSLLETYCIVPATAPFCTLASSLAVMPFAPRVIAFVFSVRLAGAAFTVTAHRAFLPLGVLMAMFAVPGFTAVTTPFSTVAMAALELTHRVSGLASAGNTAPSSSSVMPTPMVALERFRVTLVGAL